MATEVYESWSKRNPFNITLGDTNLHIIASDGTFYSTIAALQLAGKTPLSLVQGKVLIRTDASGTAGSGFYLTTDPPPGTIPITGFLVDGGIIFPLPGPFAELWVALTTNSDNIDIWVWE